MRGVSYSNGNVGACACGQTAVDSCHRCGTMVCDTHARLLPDAPEGISADALSRFEIAIRAGGPYCENCRADIGSVALAKATNAPRAQLPEHWLDRAIALNGDQTRSNLEKLEDADLPATLTAKDVAAEFLRRIGQQPSERVPISPPSFMRTPEFVAGWSVDCRRTQYTAAGGPQARYPLPCLISTEGELLGPVLEEGDRHGQTWWIVPESDIELSRLVKGVAQLLLLSAFAPPPQNA
ncbi:MAG: hypothetical protein AVDCRST_MAG67-667 [uncultured Solirubrobacteraceae bacterium]|uniref:Uncharacterized protein n=1 Tax=uncultured Solirubrobacteraceae bacterium TaxID=1162706 RepID=A0A6J4RUL7_9ACTN|nr:MAG: hypothetical protein AVDCRST_MAG67-667 [uncultured Solirubrobacteraceae bacterium]